MSKLYYIDNDTLEYKPLDKYLPKKRSLISLNLTRLLYYPIIYLSLFLLGVFIGSNMVSTKPLSHHDPHKYESDLILVNLKDTLGVFSEEKLIQHIKHLNLRFPHIALAQAKLESAHFTSDLFKENHNLFGMKEAYSRINTAKGTQNKHAYYDGWKESLYDYAFYQCRYLGDIKTEDEYFLYLSKSYAEDPKYVSRLKSIIKREKLKILFEN